jgi:hypothetical protein
MSSRMLYGSTGVWLAIVAGLAGLGASSGVPISGGMAALALAVGLVPAAITIRLWGAAPQQTVAELLRPVDREV